MVQLDKEREKDEVKQTDLGTIFFFFFYAVFLIDW